MGAWYGGGGIGYPPIPLFVLKVTLNGVVCRLIKYVNMHLQTHYQSPNTQLLYSITHTMGVPY